MKLIGIYGKARSGKDTAADHLGEQFDLHQYLFAAPLKDMLTTVFGDHFYTGNRERVCPEAGVSYRVLMQTLGTEWGRTINPNLWVNLVAKRWDQVRDRQHFSQRSLNKAKGMVLSDVRFDSEAEWVKSQGGIIIEIRRRNADEIAGIENHPSEAGIRQDLIDVSIDNDGSMLEYREKLNDFMRDYLRGAS